jgi:hypothetical protein
MERNEVVPQKRIFPIDLERTNFSKLVESPCSSMPKPHQTHSSPLFSYNLFSKCTSCLLTYSIPRIYPIPFSNQAQEWNQPILYSSSNQTQEWNHPILIKWNYDITFYFVSKSNTPLLAEGVVWLHAQ